MFIVVIHKSVSTFTSTTNGKVREQNPQDYNHWTPTVGSVPPRLENPAM